MLFRSVDLFATFSGSAADFARWLADAEINRDRNLRLEYLAGRGLNVYQADVIYADMLTHAQLPPAGLFAGSPAIVDDLRQRIRSAYGRAVP